MKPMNAMVLPQIVSMAETKQPLHFVSIPKPEPIPGEILIKISVCGVCHTELDEIEGRTKPPQLPIVPGHEIVGSVAELGDQVTQFKLGDRVGVGWIHSSSGSDDENLSPDFRATGRDVNGGYAEYMTVPADYAYSIPEIFSDEQAAPLLCAGGIGYRALKLAMINDGDALGLTGFGASAHLVLQLAKHLFPNTNIFVFARDESQGRFASELGAVWVGNTSDTAPTKLNAIIDTTPAWKPVVEALRNLVPGGRLVINTIRKVDADRDYLANLRYHEHLWMEKEIKSVANITRNDIADFLPIAGQIPIIPEVVSYPLSKANQALNEIYQGGLRGARVLKIQA